jgi:hypothetical protein
MRNSLSGILTSLLNIPPLIATLLFHGDRWACIAAYLFFAAAYVSLDRALIRRHQALRKELRQSKEAGGVKSQAPMR